MLRHVGSPQLPVLLCVIILCCCHCHVVVALRPCIRGQASQQQLQSDCRWEGLPASATLSVIGALRQPSSAGPPAIVAAAVQQQPPGPLSRAEFSNVILSGFQLPAPGSRPHGLIPTGLSTSFLSLQDVRILANAAALQQHLDFFTAAAPNVTFYTDGATFLHINYFANSRVSWQSVGLLLAASLDDARSTLAVVVRSAPARGTPATGSSSSSSSSSSDGSRRGRALHNVTGDSPGGAGAANFTGSSSSPAQLRYNYVLHADNDSLVPQLQRLGRVEGRTPCLIYIGSNVTLGRPPVPPAGIVLARPLSLVGLVGHNSSIDFNMQVNQLLMNYKWSNITFDSLVVENLAPGDAKSAELARPLSVSSANNFWSLYYNRSEDRLLMKNLTYVVGSQAELDYYLYWATVYHSKLPFFKTQAQFIKDVIKIRVWKLGYQTDTSVQVAQSYSEACRIEDCTYVLQPVVARRLPVPPPLGADLKLKPSEKSTLVTAVGDAQTFKDQLRPLTGAEAARAHVILLRRNITLQPSFNRSANSSNATDAAASVPSAAALAGVPPGGGIPVPYPISVVGDLSQDSDGDYATTFLHLGFVKGLLDISGQAGGKSQVQLQHLQLQGLAQGPGAAAASSLQSPEVWTLLGWAFERSADNDVVLSGCVLELPPPEFEHLAQLARQGGGQVILKLSGDVRSSGDGLVVLTGVLGRQAPYKGSRRLLQPSSALSVESLSAQGLSGTKLMLMPSQGALSAPGGYFWPGGSSSPAGSNGLSGTQLAVAVGVPVAVGAVLVAALALFILARRRRRRTHDQMLPDVSKSKALGPGLGPCSTCSSSGCSGSAGMPPGGKGSAAGQSKSHAGNMSWQDVGRGRDQNTASSMLVLRGSQDTSAAACSGDSVAAAACAAAAAGAGHVQASTGDSAESLSLVPAPCCADLQRPPEQGGAAGGIQQHQQQSAPLPASPGLSYRLTSAISHLQQDITRRRIGGALGSGSQQQQQPSSGSDQRDKSGQAPSSSTGGNSSSSGTGTNAASSSTGGSGHNAAAPRNRCSLVASRSPAMAESAAAIANGAAPAELQILTLIGRGSFASVYRAVWRGRCVALKVVQLPAGLADVDSDLSTALKARERMAVMEAVVSVTMSHPNIVQVYTFALQPLFPNSPVSPFAEQAGCAAAGQQREAGVSGFELQLIMQYCEEGSLRSALNQQRLVDPSAPVRLPAVHLVLALAHDVACAMLHLHSESIVHSDLKASNVLLTKGTTVAPFAALEGASELPSAALAMGASRPGSCAALLAAAQAAAGGRLIAKVADFGLSLALDPDSTHISQMHAGTLTHMAPELLLHGRASKASDVYAFGILLWELVTGLRAFQGMPVALVGHSVTQLRMRPPWVAGVAAPLKQLVEECWAHAPNDRPPFSSIVLRLEQLLQQTPEELSAEQQPQDAAVAAAASSSQRPQGEAGSSRQSNQQAERLAAPGLAVFAPQLAVAGVASPTAEAGDAGVTGDWTM